MSNLKFKQNKCIFDSIEEVNLKYGVELKYPVNIPEGSNFACYSIEDLYDVKFLQFYREDNLGLCYYSFNTEVWYLVNQTLEKEILEDFITIGPKYIYLRLTKQEDDKPKEINMNKHIFESLVKLNASCYFPLILPVKDKFTPERLLGVETDKGFITAVYKYDYNKEGFVFDLDGIGQYLPFAFRYYISDDSDETVSFEEYVKLFYNTENT